MIWITTVSFVTNMIKDWNVRSLPIWDYANQPSVHETVYVDSFMVKTGIPVTVRISTALPEPAPSRSIKVNPRKDGGCFFLCNTRYDKFLVHVGIMRPYHARVKGADFIFPYEMNGVQATKRNVRKLFWETGFDGQKYPLSWLLDKFWPVPGWSEEQRIALKREGR